MTIGGMAANAVKNLLGPDEGAALPQQSKNTNSISSVQTQRYSPPEMQPSDKGKPSSTTQILGSFVSNLPVLGPFVNSISKVGQKSSELSGPTLPFYKDGSTKKP